MAGNQEKAEQKVEKQTAPRTRKAATTTKPDFKNFGDIYGESLPRRIPARRATIQENTGKETTVPEVDIVSKDTEKDAASSLSPAVTPREEKVERLDINIEEEKKMEQAAWSRNGQYRRRSTWDPSFVQIAYKDFKFVQQPSSQNIAIVHYQDTKQSLSDLVGTHACQEKVVDTSLESRARSVASIVMDKTSKAATATAAAKTTAAAKAAATAAEPDSASEHETEVLTKSRKDTSHDVISEETEDAQKTEKKTDKQTDSKLTDEVQQTEVEGEEKAVEKEGPSESKDDVPQGLDKAILRKIVSGFGAMAKPDGKAAGGTDDFSKQLSMKSVSGLKRWKKKSVQKKTLRQFANDVAHLKFLRQVSQNASVEVPAPARVLVLEEAFPIVKKTVAAYEKLLGKDHDMTRQSRDKLEELARLMEEVEAL